MMKKKARSYLALLLAAVLFGGCALPGTTGQETGGVPGQTKQEQETEAKMPSSDAAETAEESSAADGTDGQAQAGQPAEQDARIAGRPTLLAAAGQTAGEQTETGEQTAPVTACVPAYTIAPDLSNVINREQFYLTTYEEVKEKLSQNGFVVSENAGYEFYEVYEYNRYERIPNFITVDSLMHTYHLYFAYLLKKVEKETLAASLTELSGRMLDNSLAQYARLAGTEWEEAARRNVAYFAVGDSLLAGSGDSLDRALADKEVAEIVGYELENIRQAAGVSECAITGEFEDYSQYIPRGYYEGDALLESYFQAMMWYGRVHLEQKKEDLDRSALLLTLALTEDAKALELWEGLYAVTSFFAGASDDLGVWDYDPVLRSAYGDAVSLDDLPGNEAAFEAFHAMTALLAPPQLNSVPIWDGEDNTILGFRFMGQRFTIDGMIMQRLIYSDVKKNSKGDRRMLPDVLDVPAALGSDMALSILEKKGATDYAGYPEHMELLRAVLADEDKPLWNASLYAGWLHTLRPLLTPKKEGYPVFMQNEEWTKKNLECFAGSFTELKHDTVLYAKQVIAEMGGGYDENIDDRGYAEPEPLVYERFAALSEQTMQGLAAYHMLTEEDRENLNRLTAMAKQLCVISQKELQGEVLTEDEYEFIRTYGGSLEHFWYETVKENSDMEYIDTAEFPAALVTDIATDPDGSGRVLEIGTGHPATLYVVIQVDGKVKLAKGSVYSFYQFEWPLNERLTDTKWREMMGFEMREDGTMQEKKPVPKPDWTESYRYHFEWEG